MYVLLLAVVVLCLPWQAHAALNCADANAFAIEDGAGPNPVSSTYTLAGGLSDTVGLSFRRTVEVVGH